MYFLWGPISHRSSLTKKSKKLLSNYYYSLGGVALLSEFLGLRYCRKVRQSATTKLPDHKDTTRSGGLLTAKYIEFSYSSGGFWEFLASKESLPSKQSLDYREAHKGPVSLCWMCVYYETNMAREFILNLFD